MIWLIGGTAPSREVADFLNHHDYDYVVSTATAEGRELYRKNCPVHIVTRPMGPVGMLLFVKRYGIRCIIDASHPYARNVSHKAMITASKCSISFIRFERKELAPLAHAKGVSYFSTIKEIRDYLEDKEGNVFLSTGARSLIAWKGFPLERITVRVIPTVDSIKRCAKIGLSYRHIIAMSGPYSDEFNTLVFRERAISYLVTKQSGSEGGFMEKVTPALTMGIEVCCLKVPQLDYPYTATTTAELEKLLKGVN